MPNKSGRSTEHDIALAALRYLDTVPSGEASIAEIKAHVPNFINLTPADLAQSPTRDNESVWEQQVRNIISHRGTDGNAIHDGLLSYSPATMGITDAGRFWVKKKS